MQQVTRLSLMAAFLTATLPLNALAVFSVQDIRPLRGVPGTLIEVSVDDLDTGSVTVLKLADQTITPILVETERVQFIVPATASSGTVEVENNGITMRAVMPFTVTRTVSGQFQPPAGVSLTPEWSTLSLNGTGVVSTVDGSFSFDARKDGPTVVFLTREEADPVFLACVVSDEGTIVIDAQSTAVTYPLLMPGLSTLDDADSRARKSLVQASDKLSAFTTLIANGSADGQSPLDTLGFDDRVLELFRDVQARLPQARPARRAGLPKGLRLIDLNTNADGGIRRFEIAASAPMRNQPYYSIKHVASLNPTDWMLEAYPIDIFGMDDYASLIASVNSTSALPFLSQSPISSGSVQATLNTAKLDLLGRLADAIIDTSIEAAGFDPAAAKPDPNEIRLPDAPGVYVVQAYSGALYHGLTDQSDILDANDPKHRWLTMLGINSFLIAIDTIKIAVPFPQDGPALGKALNGMLLDTEKLLASRAGTGTLEENTALIRKLITTISKALIKGLIGSADDIKFSKIVKGVGKTIGRVFDISGKAATAGGAIERRIGLTSSTSLALERSVIVVGDPWGPTIERFSPLEGEAGQTIEIFGDNFGWVKEDVTVTFCTFGSTDNTNLTGSVEATVEEIAANRILVKVPDHSDWVTGFMGAIPAPKKVNVCVERSSMFSTSLSADPAEWTYIPPPQITGIEPATLTGTEPFVLSGGTFNKNDWRHYRLLLDGTLLLHVHSISATGMVTRIPNNVANGMHTIELHVGDLVSSVPVEIQLPERGNAPSTGFPVGATLFVTTNLDNTAPDNHITLREAFHISAGTLGREMTEDEEDRLVFWTPGTPIGAGARDTLDMQLIANGTTFSISSALPSPGSGDHFNLDHIIITGSGTTALQFDAITHSTIQNATINNFDGNGLTLSFAANNLINAITITNVTGDGVQLTNSDFNQFTSISALGGDGDGFRLAINSDGNVFSQTTSAFNGGHGFNIAGGAQNHLANQVQFLSNAGDGLRLTGANTRFNYMVGDTFDQDQDIANNQGAGIRLSDGAAYNVIQPEFVISNAVAGIVLSGHGVFQNTIGDPTVINGPRAQPLLAIYGNQGPGIQLSNNTHDNHLYKINIAGSAGDGIEVMDAGTDANRIRTLFTGIELIGNAPNTVNPNVGFSLHIHGGATDTLLWGRENNVAHRNALLHDTLGAVHIADPGTSGNAIDFTYIGNGYPITGYLNGAFTGQYPSQGIGSNAVVIANGASSNRIDRTLITDCAGTAVTLRGNTAFNRLMRTQVGLNTASVKPSVGIALLDGPQGNQIGKPGDKIGTLFNTGFNNFPQAADVLVVHARNIAIHLRNCGGDVDPSDNPVNPNLIQSAVFNSDHTGMKLEGDTWVNTIGGPRRGPQGFVLADEVYMQEACNFFGATNGIVIEGVIIPSPGARNRFEYNRINCGQFSAPASALSVGAAPLPGTGVLITGGSGNNIFGETAGRPNLIFNCQVGIDLDHTVAATIRGNEIGEAFSIGAHIAGLVIRGGQENKIGEPGTGANVFLRNRFAGPSTIDDGLVLVNTVGNKIRNNAIQGFGNTGVTVDESQENRFGGPSRAEENEIINGGGIGLHIDGTTTTGNQFERNTLSGNDDGGVLVVNGASANTIGGARILNNNGTSNLIYSPNTIEQNGGPGVEVATGLPLIDTPILFNSISGNQTGIVLTAGGNNDLPAPIDVLWTGGSVQGQVSSTAEVPVGSWVQVFSDPGGEGKALIGEAEVKVDGSWIVPVSMPPPFANVTATVTDPATLATSPFSLPAQVPPSSFELQRSDGGVPVAHTLASNVGCARVLALTGIAREEPMLLKSLDISYTGTLVVTNLDAIVAYEDRDRDGVIGGGDSLVATATYTNSLIHLSFSNVVAFEDAPLNVLIALKDTAFPEGDTLQLVVTNVSAVGAVQLFPIGGLANIIGNFPIQGDIYTIGPAATGYVAWRSQHWSGSDLTDDLVSGPDADADGDGYTNIEEYYAGTDPRNPGSLLTLQSFDSVIGQSNFEFSFDALASRTYRVTGRTAPQGQSGWTNIVSGITTPTNGPIRVAIPQAILGVLRVEVENPPAP